MHYIEISVVIGYFIILILLGKYAKRRTSNSSDFILAGRNLGTVLVTTSVVGLWLGGMSTIGASEMAFNMGYFPIWFNISVAIGMLFFSFTLAIVYRKSRVKTVGEMLEKIFNKDVRTAVSIAFLIAAIILSFLQLKAIGTLFSQLFNLPTQISIIISGIVVIFYIYEGGMKSLAITNFIHVVLLLVSTLVIFFIILNKVGGFEELFIKLNERFLLEGQSVESANILVSNYKNPFSPGISKSIAWIIGGILAVFATQASLQPIFAAKDVRTAKRASIFSALLIAPLGFFIATIGIAVRTGFFGILSPEKANETIPFLLMKGEVMSPWLAGLVSAGIIAAIFSTLGPTIFAATTILVNDVCPVIRKDKSKPIEDSRKLKNSKIVTVSIGIIIIPMALFIDSGILESAYITYAIRSSAAILILFGFYFVSKKTGRTIFTNISAIVSIISAIFGIVLFLVFNDFFTEMSLNLGFAIDKVFVTLFFAISGLIITTLFTKDKKITTEHTELHGSRSNN